ncbi:phage holin family protein [Nocardiopsis alba]|uniref:phage holin family protein n=1 Tax=Nocardiopsis alba TaxID=53437 RepID=UPI0033AED4DA
MVDKPGAGRPGAASDPERSIGELVSDATDNLSRLVRLEIKLAKLEAKADATKIGKSIGEFGAAGVVLHLVAILFSVTIGLFLAEVVGWQYWLSFLAVTGFYLLVALIFILVAVINLRRRQGLARTAVTTSRLMGILRGEIRPPKRNDLDTAEEGETSGSANS